MLLLVLLLLAGTARADEPWVAPGPDGAPQIQLYFFWSLTCPHCTAAHPHIEAIPGQRPWVRLRALELSREADNLRRYSVLSRQVGAEPDGVPAWIFCGEMHTGWDGDERTGAMRRGRLDACRARLVSGAAPVVAPPVATGIDLPLFGRIDPAMLAATVVLAIAANFYELLCTAGFPMVFTRLLTLAELSPAGRYAYLAAYNLIYVLPLAAIVAVFAGTLGARKLSEREGRLLKLMSGLMMLGLGLLLLLAPERLSQIGIAFGLMALALAATLLAAGLTKESTP